MSRLFFFIPKELGTWHAEIFLISLEIKQNATKMSVDLLWPRKTLKLQKTSQSPNIFGRKLIAREQVFKLSGVQNRLLSKKIFRKLIY